MTATVIDPVEPVRLDDASAGRDRVSPIHAAGGAASRPRVAFVGGGAPRRSFASAFVAFALALAALGAVVGLARAASEGGGA